MEIIYRNHIVRERTFEDYSSEDVQSINSAIVSILPKHIEDFHFYNDRYAPITSRGKVLFQKIVSQYAPVLFTEFSFSNQEKRIYKKGTFIIQ